MEPLTLMAIGMGVGAVGKAVGGAIDASSIYTKADKERLEELERLQDLNALGLTDEEISVLQEQMIDPVAAMQAQRNIQRRELAAASDLGAGAVAKQMIQEDDMAQRQEAQVARNLAQLDLQQKKAQEAEIKQLEKQRDLKGKAMLSAAVRGTADLASLGLTAAGKQMELKELTGQAGALSAQQQAQLAQQMQMQRYMSQFYGPGYNPYFQYYQNYYGSSGQVPMLPMFGPGVPQK
tara:strand:- start:1791 stop:2498 length:708 start_codon:yes stop_codon:yes gene_type:complete